MQINLAEANNLLPHLIAAVEHGEEVILARDGVPVARLVQYTAPKVRPPGAWKDRVAYSEEWNSPETSAEIERMFLGENDADAS